MARNKKSVIQRKKRALAFMTRGQALRKLQLSLKDFRQLCIIKGIYPVEPSKKVDKTSQAKTYYLRKDILYLSHEPIIWKFWDLKIFMKRMAKAKNRRDRESVERIRENKPFYKLDHIVKERYPNFLDALRDLDDALSMCFLYSMFGKSKVLPLELIELSRRLTLEFMYYVMETKSLRKVFISIKGYYYEANIMGQTIQWIVPHKFVMNQVADVDFEIMKTFTEFYITLLGFVNYKLYTSSSYFYPPSIMAAKAGEEDEFDMQEAIASLNKPLVTNDNVSKVILDEQQNIDHFEGDEDDAQPKFGSSQLSFQQLQRLQQLFAGCKFYLNREVPRETLCFVIRAFSGQVSWDKTLYEGALFDESDETITHQICDRPDVSKRYANRYYIQPQWVFDCINARTLLPVQNYFLGCKLPPHLSPFVEEKPGDYIPPEKLALLGINNNKDEEEEPEVEETETPAVEEEEELEEENVVEKGKVVKVDKNKLKEKQLNEEKRLKVMSMPKKKKKLYDKIMYSIKHKNKETDKLKRKRQDIEIGNKRARRANP